ncbi:hypothetical protein C8R44DRAFT_770313 [Mycena epipterygia]|nr:hypothetical protein C8R44DRAFT_770313 [Mycena epipterygia]
MRTRSTTPHPRGQVYPERIVFRAAANARHLAPRRRPSQPAHRPTSPKIRRFHSCPRSRSPPDGSYPEDACISRAHRFMLQQSSRKKNPRPQRALSALFCPSPRIPSHARRTRSDRFSAGRRGGPRPRGVCKWLRRPFIMGCRGRSYILLTFAFGNK